MCVSVFYMMSTLIFFFEIPMDLLISVIAYLINFKHGKISRATDHLWLALKVPVV